MRISINKKKRLNLRDIYNHSMIALKNESSALRMTSHSSNFLNSELFFKFLLITGWNAARVMESVSDVTRRHCLFALSKGKIEKIVTFYCARTGMSIQ